MRVSIKELATILQQQFHGRQTWGGVNSRNKRPAKGWTVIGHCGLTRAIKLAGLPTAKYWSGSNPTPSTQAPAVIVEEAYKYLD